MAELDRLNETIFHLKKKKIIKKQDEIAILTGYNKSSISEILNGKVQLSDKFLKIFCSTFGINLEYIEKGQGKIFIEDFKPLNEQQIKHAPTLKKLLDMDYEALLQKFNVEKDLTQKISRLNIQLERENIELKFKYNRLVEICKNCETCKTALENGTIQTAPS